MKKNRLTIEDRILIEELLRLNYKLKDIAKVMHFFLLLYISIKITPFGNNVNNM